MNKKEVLKDAVWHLTCSASSLHGLNGYEKSEEAILKIRDELRKMQ
jgi:hypothetical protein